jgi:hypothetical protein
MTQSQETNSFVASKFGKILLTVLTMVLIFAGPTYVVYALTVILKINFAASIITGFALLIVGLVMLRFLVKKQIIT